MKFKLGRSKASRTGVPNYTDEDINDLLSIVEDVEPIGASEWSLVPSKFATLVKENNRAVRNMDSLKLKLDHLANQKKPTGDPSCPVNVRRAKHIVHDILSRVNAVCVREVSSESGSSEDSDHASASRGKKRINSDASVLVRQ